MKNKLTIALVEAQIKKQQDFITECGRSSNPQVVKMVDHAKGQLDAYEAVLWAMRGSAVLILP